MNTQILKNNIRFSCQANADEERAKKFQYYFKHPVDAYGLTSPQVNLIVKNILQQERPTVATVFESLHEFLCNGKYEEISCCLLLLDALAKQFTKDTFYAFNAVFAKGIDNWAHADTLGMFVFPKFIKQNLLEIQDFEPWLHSPYIFQRRCVPVTFIKAMKISKDVLPFIEIVAPLMTDPEREVHQGMGWFLREAWKIQRQETETFLEQWKNTAPRLIMQYACEKMTTEEKQRFKREQK